MISLMGALRHIQRADTQYLVAQNYWRGEGLSEVFSNENLAAVLASTAEHYHVNICKRASDAVLDRLEIGSVKFLRNSTPDDTAAEAFRVKVAEPSRLEQVLEDAFELAEEYGDSYLLTWPDAAPEASEVKASAFSPVGARMFYDDDDPTVPVKWVRTWLVEPPAGSKWAQGAEAQDPKNRFRRVDTIDRENVTRQISTLPAAEVTTEDQFEPYTGQDSEDTAIPGVEPVPVPGEMCVKHLRTRRPYGEPEHKPLYGVQNMLIKAMVTLAESLDGFAVPFRYKLRQSQTALSSGSDVFDQDREVDAEDKGRSQLSSRPGQLAELWDTDSVGQLMPSDVANLLDPIDKVMALAAMVTGLPLDYFDQIAGNASGKARQEDRDPMNRKVGKRQRDFGSEIEDAYELALRMLGHDGVTVELKWEAPDKPSNAERYANITAAQAAGYTFEQAAVDNGADPEELDNGEWRNRSADLAKLQILGDALQKMGAASQLLPGVITPELINTALTALLPSKPGNGDTVTGTTSN